MITQRRNLITGRRGLACLAAVTLLAVLAARTPAARPVASDKPAATAIQEPAITAKDWAHWSYQPLHRPDLPRVRHADWARNPIDFFIAARLEAAGLDPAPPADRVTLIRRVTFDLTGLPPTPAEVDAFVNDTSADAYERVVDRLLASPTYGQRWAQHWLDLARFAQTDGFEHDNVRPDAWRYRDWVIEALNRDLPYDRFVQLLLAGDELPAAPVDGDAAGDNAIATGFLVCGPDMPDINLQDERRHVVLNDITSTVGAVLLGMQMGCAQCHDHKYDPISQADFYRLRAVFAGAVPILKRDKQLGNAVYEAGAQPVATHLMIRGDFRRPGPQVEPAFPRIAAAWKNNGSGAAFDAFAIDVKQSSGRRAALARWITQPDHPLTLRVIVNRLWQHHFNRPIVATPSDFGAQGGRPTHPQLLDWLATELPRRGWSLKAMHRLMVSSATYRQSSRLDADLAQRQPDGAVATNWRRAVQADPANVLLWRMNRRRLEGEAIRDAMLATSADLNMAHGGPSVRPPLPDEVVSTLLRKDHWEVSADPAQQRRRSIYVFVRRNLGFPMFEAFDKPDTNASCARRAQSTTAPQSLVLLNAQFALTAARRLAGQVLGQAVQPGDAADSAALVRACYRRALSRTPTADEQRLGEAFLRDQAQRLVATGRKPADLALPAPMARGVDPALAAALTDYCLTLFNLNEFIYVD